MTSQDPYAAVPAGLTGPSYSIVKDTGLWMVVLGNLIVLGIAQANDWPLGEILWVYWLQSVIIGALNVVRMARLENYSTENFTMNGHPVQATAGAKIRVIIFFIVHYGFFHFVYLIFLAVQYGDQLGHAGAGIAAAIFLLSHIVSMFRNAISGVAEVKLNLGALMFLPYMRILPMHIIIILGATTVTKEFLGVEITATSLAIFMVLKTFADGGMHVAEQLIYLAGEKAARKERGA